ncbi:hypothetical protein C6A87_004505 [Mycobacterium sp. ITM-2016-00317]|uniref:hypothetical protein n=1 Tax=Mycobacterium sp. ITM-2016-00317 TaxID=2099694 RepID=UPI000D4A036E|nr:hypothetical protein [Mycobacterium sp. ITM-2016-00317]WNG88509.1 hypothetical protein C6A87_004505 [Mycobacterium sp. ITM-2016-00317]
MAASHKIPGTDIPFYFCADWDGTNFVLVDERDFDMTGWRIEAERYDGDTRVTEFHRSASFFNAGQHWNGIGGGLLRTPWSAVCGFPEKIIRWIPPTEE